ncbi:hypothetical protein PCA31118_03930 [Pandoraea captiosa]|uniref:Uncharacterized protein n=1 Tax=Pandoraea captiosa TaxID=2508302 RepID=A0A5E5AGI2_9BURK|nr:hypothetical protein [Pandoraea captiosa]VVE71635.1 hypothetical protein PCA31118_03930 [Pandoraea captiosa]
MEKHHEAQLNQALDDLYLVGHVSIRWDYFYHWYNIDRLAKAPWRDIETRWAELCEAKGFKKPVGIVVVQKPHFAVFRRNLLASEKEQTLSDLAS